MTPHPRHPDRSTQQRNLFIIWTVINSDVATSLGFLTIICSIVIHVIDLSAYSWSHEHLPRRWRPGSLLDAVQRYPLSNLNVRWRVLHVQSLSGRSVQRYIPCRTSKTVLIVVAAFSPEDDRLTLSRHKLPLYSSRRKLPLFNVNLVVEDNCDGIVVIEDNRDFLPLSDRTLGFESL
eukprot:935613-Amorphochlora_amoeboformis.AAC.1